MTRHRSLKKAPANPALVTGLDLRQEKPHYLPDMQPFANLEFIDLSNCPSLDWQDACLKLANLSRLTEIKAFNAGITALPDELGLLTHLKKIDFSSNSELTALPETFHKLTALEEINFHDCGLQALPEISWHFPNLHTLTLSHNKLSTIPQPFFTHLPALLYLSIEDNGLTVLPESICQLQNLQSLYAGENSFQELPAHFSLLTRLETLWLDRCTALDYEQELRKVVAMPLKNLTLLGNNLSVLPTAFRQLTSVEILTISSNKFNHITHLLEGLAHLPLRELDIRFMPDMSRIYLESARIIIPTLQQIYCDSRSPAEYSNDIYEWVLAEFNLSTGTPLSYKTDVAEFLALVSGTKTVLEYGNYPDDLVPTEVNIRTEYQDKNYRASFAISDIQTRVEHHYSLEYLGIEERDETIATLSLGTLTYQDDIDILPE